MTVRKEMINAEKEGLAHRAHCAKETELRELRENKRLKKEGRKSSLHFEDAGEEGKIASLEERPAVAIHQ